MSTSEHRFRLVVVDGHDVLMIPDKERPVLLGGAQLRSALRLLGFPVPADLLPPRPEVDLTPEKDKLRAEIAAKAPAEPVQSVLQPRLPSAILTPDRPSTPAPGPANGHLDEIVHRAARKRRGRPPTKVKSLAKATIHDAHVSLGVNARKVMLAIIRLGVPSSQAMLRAELPGMPEGTISGRLSLLRAAGLLSSYLDAGRMLYSVTTRGEEILTMPEAEMIKAGGQHEERTH